MMARWYQLLPAVALIVVLPTITGFWMISNRIDAQRKDSADALYHNQLDSCRRGNLLRKESNQRVAAHITERDIVAAFLASAERARRESGSPTDLRAAAANHAEREKLLNFTHYELVPIIDCKSKIKKP